MALFRRGKVPPIDGNNRLTSWSNKGFSRGRGRSRVRNDHGTRPGRKSTFYSTRVEEQPEKAASNDGENANLEESGHSQESSDSSSNDEDEYLLHNTVKPYNALLQSLNTGVQGGEPQPKKRKVEDPRGSPEITPSISSNEALDKADEREGAEDFNVDEVEYSDYHDDVSDPFLKHFDDCEEKELPAKIRDVESNSWVSRTSDAKSSWSFSIKVPQTSASTLIHGSEVVSNTEALFLKQRLSETSKKSLPLLDTLSGNLASSIFNYRDIFFPERTLQNADTLRKLTCLHALNHIFKTRDKVLKNNTRLAKEDIKDIECRDQGFTRPKVLIILPTRHSCVKYVDTIISYCDPEQQENKKRFQESYASGDDHFSEDKPIDFRELFAGNDDDLFRLGLKFTRKTVKFFAQFYNSDIIFASPLGLRMALGADDPKKQDHDFLSSIEVVVTDQADAMLMQNWEHVEYIFEHLNHQPKQAHGCDFSRVRNWYLDGHARYLRQTILFSGFVFPSLNRLFSNHMLNVDGKMKYSIGTEGAMVDLATSPRQTFSRFESASPATEPDDRFKYFSTAIVPSLTKHSRYSGGVGQGVLIYFSSYADFVRTRNHLATSSATQDISFGSISEYTNIRDVARARSHFYSGRHSVLLYTERAHHFRRYHLKGVKKVILYGLPENPIFYKEIVGGYLASSIMAGKLNARDASARILFSKLDALKLERIVGTGRFLSMLREKGGDTFDFI